MLFIKIIWPSAPLSRPLATSPFVSFGRNQSSDPPVAQAGPDRSSIITSVAQQSFGPLPGTAWSPPWNANDVQGRRQMPAFVGLSGGQPGRQWSAFTVTDQMNFGA